MNHWTLFVVLLGTKRSLISSSGRSKPNWQIVRTLFFKLILQVTEKNSSLLSQGGNLLTCVHKIPDVVLPRGLHSLPVPGSFFLSQLHFLCVCFIFALVVARWPQQPQLYIFIIESSWKVSLPLMNTNLGPDCHCFTLWCVSAPEAVTMSRETRKVLISWAQFTVHMSPSELGWKSEGGWCPR